MKSRVIILLTLMLALALPTSCSQQVTKPLGEGILNPNKTPKIASEDIANAKRSAGVTIYGNTEKVELFIGEKCLVLKPGDESYDKITHVCERIILRVGELTDERPVSNADYSKMMCEARMSVRLTYHQQPIFFARGIVDHSKRDKVPPVVTGLNQVTFFIPVSPISFKPDTIYDGFYYGNIHMLSTLTNMELFESVKGLK